MQKEKVKSKADKASVRDFRHLLQDELTQRCSRNPKYSLRSFAKFLTVSPAALSDILNGKRPITYKMKERIGLQLGLTLADLENYRAKPHGNTRLNQIKNAPDITFRPVTIDVFSIISEPYHYALLELIKTKKFKWDAKWIARRLGLTVSEVKIAIERLERVGLLERDDSGEFYDATHGFRTDIREGLTSEAQRRSQIRALEIATAAIRTIPIERRDNTTMTIALNNSDLPKAKQMIKEFRRRFCIDLETNKNLDEVYQLAISFVPLTQLDDEN